MSFEKKYSQWKDYEVLGVKYKFAVICTVCRDAFYWYLISEMDSPNSPTNEGTSDAGKQNGATQKHKKGGQSSARQRYKMGKT